MEKQNLNRRQAQWGAELAEFDFLLHYRKGYMMGQSDGLLRCPDLVEGIELNNTDQILLPVHRLADLCALKTGTLIHSEGDEIVRQISNSTEEYDKKVEVAVDEASRSPNHKVKDMAVWEKNEGLILRNGLVVVLRN
jgi:hypothetical protein